MFIEDPKQAIDLLDEFIRTKMREEFERSTSTSPNLQNRIQEDHQYLFDALEVLRDL